MQEIQLRNYCLVGKQNFKATPTFQKTLQIPTGKKIMMFTVFLTFKLVLLPQIEKCNVQIMNCLNFNNLFLIINKLQRPINQFLNSFKSYTQSKNKVMQPHTVQCNIFNLRHTVLICLLLNISLRVLQMFSKNLYYYLINFRCSKENVITFEFEV